jgi:hypothetical protein
MHSERRLSKLEQAVGAGGPECPACHGFYIVSRLSDAGRPDACPTCGAPPVVVARRVPARCPVER